MAGLLSNFRNTMIVSVLLALVMVFAYSQSPQGLDATYLQAVARWLQACGMDLKNMEVTGRGSTEPITRKMEMTAEEFAARNRRSRCSAPTR